MHHRGAGRPKIAELLARPEAHLVREELRLARSIGVAPSILRASRLVTTTYLYDDPAHPNRVTGAVQSPAFTADDRALLLALVQYEESLCPGCGEPKAQAWHGDADGWYEGHQWVCHACTARGGEDAPEVVYGTARVRPDAADDWAKSLTPLEIGVNTTEPAPPPAT